MGFILSIIIGGIAGFIAGNLTKGSGFGFWLNILVGIIGGFLGDLVLGLLGFSSHGIIADLVVSVFGALLLLWIVSKIKK